MKLKGNTIVDNLGEVHSVYPYYTGLTFYPFIYLVPQFKPESVLMLGYGGGAAAGFIRQFYGDVPITAVDLEDFSDMNFYDVKLINQDAEEYVRNCQDHFDCIIVDLYREGSYRPEPFVTFPDFATKLKQMGNYLIFQVTPQEDMSVYGTPLRVLHQNTTIKDLDGTFYYFMVKDNPAIPIR